MYWKFKDWIYIFITNPFKTMNKLKGVFKPLKCYFKVTTDWRTIPITWCSRPSYISIIFEDVGWKDKWSTPRYEDPPYIWIHLFGLNFLWYWTLPPHQWKDVDDYWEQALWYLYYYKNISQGRLDAPNIDKARESWPWQDYETKKSSWNDKFLIN